MPPPTGAMPPTPIVSRPRQAPPQSGSLLPLWIGLGVVLVLGAAGGGGYWYWTHRASAQDTQQTSSADSSPASSSTTAASPASVSPQTPYAPVVASTPDSTPSPAVPTAAADAANAMSAANPAAAPANDAAPGTPPAADTAAAQSAGAQASFDCSKAATPTEIAICASPELSALDGQMGVAFRARLAVDPGEKARQRQWLKQHIVPCGSDAQCLQAQLSARVQQLQQPMQPAPAQAAPPRQPSGMDSAARQMLADGQACYDRQDYTCAITNATNALRVKPGYPAAEVLKSRAQAAQSQAMNNIDIH